MTLKIKEGGRFERLEVQSREGKDKDNLQLYKCVCDCGEVVTVQGSYLKRGKVKSCGCLRLDRLKAKLTKHGMKDSPTYSSWCAMKTRCLNENTHAYIRYGGRGVEVCDSWSESFEHFFDDMGERPEGKTLNRVNGAMIYSKETCEWATPTEQARDQDTNVDSATGMRGVTISRDGYVVRITTDDERKYLGQFKDFFEACCIRKAAELEYWYGSKNVAPSPFANKPEYYLAVDTQKEEFRAINLTRLISCKVNGVDYEFED